METSQEGLHLIPLLILIVFSALTACADYALRGVKLNKIKKDADQGDIIAGKIHRLCLLDEPYGLKIARAFVEIIIIALLTKSFNLLSQTPFDNIENGINNILRQGFILIRFAFICFLIVLMLRVLPKRVARCDAEKAIRYLYPLASFANAIFAPLAFLIRALDKAIGSMLKLQGDETDNRVTEDEIRMMVDEGEEKGAIEEAERDMIENVFEFNNLTAADCMTHRTDMYAIWLHDDDKGIMQTIQESGMSRFPVYEEDLDQVIGTITTRDYLINRLLEHPKPLKSLIRKAHFVPETVRSDLLFRQMQQGKYHMAIVVDEYGGTSGLVTMEDLIEQIFGNIYDEYDPQAQQDIVKKQEGLWLVQGSVEIEAFNEETGNNLPIDEEFETIGGFILSKLGYIPEEGTTPSFSLDGLSYKVELVKDRRIEWVEVKKEM